MFLRIPASEYSRVPPGTCPCAAWPSEDSVLGHADINVILAADIMLIQNIDDKRIPDFKLAFSRSQQFVWHSVYLGL